MIFEIKKLAGILLMTAVFGFILYRRVRATVGRQRLRSRVLIVRLTFLALVVGAIVSSGAATVTGWFYAGTGAVLGGALAIFALRRTTVERMPDGAYYTPHLFIGLAVTGLLVLRIAYRLVSGVQSAVPAHSPLAITAGNPLTLGFLLLTVGYYFLYGAGLLLKHRRLELQTAEESAGGEAEIRSSAVS